MKQTIMYIAAAIILLLIGILIGSRFSASSQTTQTTQVYTSASTQLTTIPGTTINTVSSTFNTTTSAPTTTVKPVYAVELEYNISIGLHLVNASRYTLYLNSQDRRNNANGSICYQQCGVYWKPFYVANLTVQPNLNISNFGTITRVGGQKQLTYDGYPLYTYTVDTHPGEIAGQGVAGTWSVVTYPNLST